MSEYISRIRGIIRLGKEWSARLFQRDAEEANFLSSARLEIDPPTLASESWLRLGK